jgi:hypothetical protein
LSGVGMAFPIKVCIVCEEEFELKPDKPGFANRCPECSAPEETETTVRGHTNADDRWSASEMNEARRRVIREMLYRRDT